MIRATTLISPLDFFIALIARANVKFIPRNVTCLVQNLFSHNATIPNGLPSLNFVKQNDFIFCEDFETAMRIFRFCNMIVFSNPHYNLAYVQATLISTYKEHIEHKLTQEQVNYIDKMTKFLQEESDET